MDFPGIPGMSGGGGGDNVAGMTEQEATMVKAVSITETNTDHGVTSILTLYVTDASGHGELRREERDLRWDGICVWRHVRTIHVKCKLAFVRRPEAGIGVIDERMPR